MVFLSYFPWRHHVASKWDNNQVSIWHKVDLLNASNRAAVSDTAYSLAFPIILVNPYWYLKKGGKSHWLWRTRGSSNWLTHRSYDLEQDPMLTWDLCTHRLTLTSKDVVQFNEEERGELKSYDLLNAMKAIFLEEGRELKQYGKIV